MAKNFTKSLVSKNLSSLIPTTDKVGKKEETAPTTKKVVKAQEPAAVKEDKTTPSVKPVITPPEPKPIKQEIAKPVIKNTPTVQEKPAIVEESIVNEPVARETTTTTVTTFRINDDKLLAIKAIAFWDRKKIQEVFDEALENYINQTPKSTLKKAVTEYKKRYNK